MQIERVCLHCSRLLRIFGHFVSTYTVAPRQCKSNKFVCIALGFCVYLATSCPHILLRLGNANQTSLFALLSASAYIWLRHLYSGASAIASKLALLSASAYIWPLRVHIYCCASAMQIKQVCLHCSRLLCIFVNIKCLG